MKLKDDELEQIARAVELASKELLNNVRMKLALVRIASESTDGLSDREIISKYKCIAELALWPKDGEEWEH